MTFPQDPVLSLSLAAAGENCGRTDFCSDSIDISPSDHKVKHTCQYNLCRACDAGLT